MYTSAHPFAPDQVVHHVKALFTTPTIFCGLGALLMQFALAAPPLWRALSLLALGAMALDVITGTLRTGCKLHQKPCAEPARKRCTMRKKNGICTFNSRDFGATIIKAAVYGVFFLIATLIDVTVHMVVDSSGGYAVATLALGTIAGREVLSNLENLRDLCVYAGISWPFGRIEHSLGRTMDALTGDPECVSVSSLEAEQLEQELLDAEDADCPRKKRTF